MNNKKKTILIIICCLFGFLILLQHHYVFIMFDDYGYASLSYGWTENQSGMLYTLKDILKFLSWHYFNWGGRILCIFNEIIVLKIGGPELIQFIQAIIILMICIISGKIISFVAKCNALYSVALSLMFYGTITLSTLRDGVYWYNASIIYVWPLLPLLASIYLYLHLQKNNSNFSKCLIVFLVFLASFSHEQISILAIVWIISTIFFVFYKNKKSNCKNNIPHYLFAMLISAVLGGMITILAPGNFLRANTAIYDEFYSKNFWARTVENIGKILDINIGSYNWVLVLIMTIFFGAATAIYFKSKKICFLTSLFLLYFIVEKILVIPYLIGIIVRFLWAICFLGTLLAYYFRRGNYLFVGMLIAGICSQGMLVISPSIAVRSHVPMEFILHIMLVECIISIYMSEFYQTKRKYHISLSVCMLGICIYAAYNSGNIISGYKHNDEINKINHYKLIEAKARNAAGDEITEIDLYKLRDDNYANCMPYHPGHEYIEVWMKNYYELPQNIHFVWHKIEDTLQFYTKSGDYYDDHWLGKNAVFGVRAKEDRVLRITVRNTKNVKGQRLSCTVAGKESVFDIPSDKPGVFDIDIPAGDNDLTIQAAQTFKPTNGDTRELSVMIDFLW